MSSFKRKAVSKQPHIAQPGTRSSPSSAATIITSTGIPSLDDILGGGLPLSCSSVILAPDVHSAYAELVAKYYIAQGLALKQRTLVVGDSAQEFVSECMWTPGASGSVPSTSGTPGDEEEEGKASDHDNKVKIAWRYEQMKKFQTTVDSPNSSTEEFCSTFDLTCRIPEQVISEASAAQTVSFIPVSHQGDASPSDIVLNQVADILQKDRRSTPWATRICVPLFGSAEWGDIVPQNVIWFLYRLRRLLRQYPHSCAMVCPASHLCEDQWGGPGWIQKLAWVSDACITLSAFGGDPSLSAIFPSHHGMVHIHAQPAPHTLLPPSDRFSALRGVFASASSAGGVGENNLAFKCMRKRLIFETLHLDVEGGVGERRTTPASTFSPMEVGSSNNTPTEQLPSVDADASRLSGDVATVEVGLEESMAQTRIASHAVSQADEIAAARKPGKAKKKVAFRSDAPDLYDF
ncbi:PAXNEB-domain-containing protein [Neolentinus lepideus HHB14362 ss-1]|uniref:Elongator complex protein 4 n=1 Tax=Neolentinus lepideus HHB14362 ss-1 TaxID=1314782 RepID=A0A165PY76_9AGAM|nr:PAXNEB-domain-containing protein [Neolentinus lepideus HHB14362 ss-1]